MLLNLRQQFVCPGSVNINIDALIHMWCLYRHGDIQTFVVIPGSTTYCIEYLYKC